MSKCYWTCRSLLTNSCTAVEDHSITNCLCQSFKCIPEYCITSSLPREFSLSEPLWCQPKHYTVRFTSGIEWTQRTCDHCSSHWPKVLQSFEKDKWQDTLTVPKPIQTACLFQHVHTKISSYINLKKMPCRSRVMVLNTQ